VRWVSAMGQLAGALGALLLLALPASAQPGVDVTIHFANDTVSLATAASTVGGLLEELSIKLPATAQVDPPANSALTDGLSVYLPQVSVTRGESEAPIPIAVQIEESWHFGPEMISAVKPGQEGLKLVSWTVFLSGNREVGRRQRVEVLRPMRPQTVVYFHELTSSDGPSTEQILKLRAKPGPYQDPPTHYKRIVTMESTAYEPGPTSCGGDTSGNTACGLKAGYGVVAVDPDTIPLGTRLFIEGYGYAVAGDTGGAIKGNIIDLGFMTLDECYAWGRRDVQVYVLY